MRYMIIGIIIFFLTGCSTVEKALAGQCIEIAPTYKGVQAGAKYCFQDKLSNKNGVLTFRIGKNDNEAEGMSGFKAGIGGIMHLIPESWIEQANKLIEKAKAKIGIKALSTKKSRSSKLKAPKTAIEIFRSHVVMQQLDAAKRGVK